MSRLEHYMTFMKLPPELQLRINNYYQARYGGKWFHERDVMETVSSALKEVRPELRGTGQGRKNAEGYMHLLSRNIWEWRKFLLGLQTAFILFSSKS